MSAVVALGIFFLFVGFMTHLERRHMAEILEEDRRKEAEHQAKMNEINDQRALFYYMAGQRSGKTLRGAAAALSFILLIPQPKKIHRSPRPNRRRKAQKLRAARQRKSWHQVLVHEDDDAR